jgi:hypothetical protein
MNVFFVLNFFQKKCLIALIITKATLFNHMQIVSLHKPGKINSLLSLKTLRRNILFHVRIKHKLQHFAVLERASLGLIQKTNILIYKMNENKARNLIMPRNTQL